MSSDYFSWDDKFDAFVSSMNTCLNDHATRNERPVRISVDVYALWEAYLSGFDNAVVRQEHNCSCCRDFVKKYGNLVIETSRTMNGPKYKSLFWGDVSQFPEQYKKSVKAMNAVISANPGQATAFVAPSQTIGSKSVMGSRFRHMCLTLPDAWAGRQGQYFSRSVRAQEAEIDENRRIFSAFMDQYSEKQFSVAHAKATSSTLYRGELVAPLLERLKVYRSAWSTRRNEILAEVQMDTALCRARSGLTGFLMELLNSGKSINVIEGEWKSRVDPHNYARSQTLPSETAVINAGQKIAEAGLDSAFKRRQLSWKEISPKLCFWRSSSVPVAEKPVSGIFANVPTKKKTEQPEDPSIASNKAVTVTWAKFKKSILPSARCIEVNTRKGSPALVGLVCGADPEAKSILWWDKPESRNPVSWYYRSSDGRTTTSPEMKRRVEQAGGKYENNNMRCTLMWHNFTDLDLHCSGPGIRHIYYANKVEGPAHLDVDANGGGAFTREPVENIRWGNNIVKDGEYIFSVLNFANREKPGDYSGFELELQVGPDIYSVSSPDTSACISGWDPDKVVRSAKGTAANLKVYVKAGRAVSVTYRGVSIAPKLAATTQGEYVKVVAVVPSPDSWHTNNDTKHVFFLCEELDDKTEPLVGGSIFAEMLHPELREMRRVIEAYASTSTIERSEYPACGYGFSESSVHPLHLRVDGQEYIIDRME